MKRVLCLCLALLFTAGILAGCGDSDTADEENAAVTEEAETVADEIAETLEAGDEDEADDNGSKHIFGTWMDLSDDAYIKMSEMLGEMLEEKGYTYDWISAENDALKQLDQIENAITQNYDLIFTFPVSGEPIADACQKAIDAGIPVYSYINDSICYTTLRKVDPASSGRIMAEYAADWALDHFPDAEEGSINVIILGNDDDEHSKIRFEALQEEIATYPELNIVEVAKVEDSIMSGYDITENLLLKHPDIQINLWINMRASAAPGTNAAIMAENSGVDYVEDVCLVMSALNEETAELLRLAETNESVLRVIAATGGRLDVNLQNVADGIEAILSGRDYAEFDPVNVDYCHYGNLSDFGY